MNDWLLVGPPFPAWFTWVDLALGVFVVVGWAAVGIYEWTKK